MGDLKKKILLTLMLCNFCFNTAVMGEIIPASVLMEQEQRNANNEVRTGKSIFYNNGDTVRIEKRKLNEKNKPDDTEREDKETGKSVEERKSESSENNNQGKAAADMGEQKTKES